MTAKHAAAHRARAIPRWPLIQSTVVTMLFAAAVAAYLVGPGMWQWAHAARIAAKADNIVEQVDTPPGPVDPILVDKLRHASTSVQAPPLILTYHDIDHNTASSRYTVTPEAFATQMQLLHDAGWTTLTANDLVRWLHGEALPPHSVMITFDDGARGVWKYADRILARNQQHALAYIITGFVGTHAPYYMTWPEITALQASGRWDLEAHTHLGHVQIPVDAAWGQAPFLTNLQYRADQQRLETPGEYHTRIGNDLVECKHQFALHNLPEPTLFAYPFSAHNDDPVGTGLLKTTVGSLYQAAMLDQPDAVVTTTVNNVAEGNIARMDVTSDVTLERWADKLDAASPLDPRAAQPLADVNGWTDSDQQPAPLVIGADNHLTLDPGPAGHLSRQYAPDRTTMWNTYTVSADLGGFGQSDGTTTGLSVLVGDPRHQTDLSVSSDAYRVDVGYGDTKPAASGDLKKAASHHVEMRVTPASVIVTIDDNTPQIISLAPAAPRLTGGGIGITADRESDSSPPSVIGNLRVY